MGGEARKCKLREVADINPESLSPNWPYDHIRYLDISSVGEGAVMAPPKLMLLSDAPSRAKRLVKAGDTVLSTVRPGRRSIFFVKETIPDLVVSTGFAVVRPRTDKVDPYFLYACVFDRSFTAYLVSREKGAAYPAVLPNDIAEAEIFLPPLPEQRAIARILGTLDDKIELNRRMNETLEAMAQALFKSWFVDFEPVVVNALKAGNPVPDKFADRAAHYRENLDRLGLPEEILRLFPDRFVDSELGPIPEGWEVKALGEIMYINPPRQLSKGEIAPYLDMANTPTSGHIPVRIISRAFNSGTKFTNGDTLIARITPCFENGKTAYVDFLKEGQVGWGSTEFIVLRPKTPLPTVLAYLIARNSKFRGYAIRSMTGSSGRQRVQISAIRNYRIAVPKINILVEFGRQISSILTLSRSIDKQSRALSVLRDTLLPKLIAGELRVPDVEKIMEEASA